MEQRWAQGIDKEASAASKTQQLELGLVAHDPSCWGRRGGSSRRMLFKAS
jgi:hypothetical protein